MATQDGPNESQWPEDEDGNRIEGGGQVAIGGTPEPIEEPPEHVLAISIPRTKVPLTEAREILASPDAADGSIKIRITIDAVVNASGGLRRLAKSIEHPVGISVDSMIVKVK